MRRSERLRVFRFTNFEKLIGVSVIHRLVRAGRPGNFHASGFRRAETEMKPLIIRGEITSRSGGVTGLPVDANACAEPVPVTPFAAKCNREPVLRAAAIH